MRSIQAVRASASARRASRSEPVHGLARAGLVARGVIYILIGVVAILVALGHSSQQADQQGALQLLAGKAYGLVALWLLGAGFAGYALWRLSVAAFGGAGEGTGMGARLKSLAQAVFYALFAVLTFEVIFGAQGNEASKQQDVTASVMRHGAGGQVLVGIVGAIIVIIGVGLVVAGTRRKFLEYLLTAQMSDRAQRAVKTLGVVGTVARGLVFVLVGAVVVDAAVTYSPSKAGLDEALLTLRGAPFGPVYLVIVAAGLIIFGVFGMCEARWRKV